MSALTLFRFLARHAFQQVIRYGPQPVKQAARRVPFSRLSWMLPALFWGDERVEWRGIHINVNPGEVHGYYVFFMGDYASHEMGELVKLSASAQVFADVGANIGLVTLALAKAHPNLQVFAFEPDPIILARLKANLALNPALIPRITLVEKAASGVDGILHFHSEATTANTGTGHLVTEAADSSFIVASTRLDTFFADLGTQPDVVKIDVEGAEGEVLLGMENLFKLHMPTHILVEVHAFYSKPHERNPFNQNIENMLIEAGYELMLLDGSPAPPANEWSERIHIKGARIARIK